MTDGVELIKETEHKTDFVASTYHIRVSDKTLDKLVEGKADPYEIVAKRARLQKDLTIPPPGELSQYLKADFELLTKAITETVAERMKNPVL